MKRNARLEERRKKIPQDVKIYVDMAFKLADQIDYILKKQGKTQRDLALALGKSESEISKWLTGEHNFTLRSIAKIQSVLNEPILLCPIELNQKIEKTMHVFVHDSYSHISTISSNKKILVKTDDTDNIKMSFSLPNLRNLTLSNARLMN
jgi:transcriptional regulator with XRE-family HTH domain